MANWLRAYRVLGMGQTPARTAAFNMATRNLGNTIGAQIDPSQYLPQQRAQGGRVWRTRHERVKATLDRHGVTLN